jgi:hypothetical protein
MVQFIEPAGEAGDFPDHPSWDWNRNRPPSGADGPVPLRRALVPNGPSSLIRPGEPALTYRNHELGLESIVCTGADGPTPYGRHRSPTVKLSSRISGGLATCPGPPEAGTGM